jgi:hypothetical protein
MRTGEHDRTGSTASSFTGDEPIDADRWLYLHVDEVVGAGSAAAVDLIEEAGLVAHVSLYRGAAPDPGVPDPGRIRLLIGDDGKVRTAQWG